MNWEKLMIELYDIFGTQRILNMVPSMLVKERILSGHWANRWSGNLPNVREQLYIWDTCALFMQDVLMLSIPNLDVKRYNTWRLYKDITLEVGESTTFQSGKVDWKCGFCKQVEITMLNLQNTFNGFEYNYTMRISGKEYHGEIINRKFKYVYLSDIYDRALELQLWLHLWYFNFFQMCTFVPVLKSNWTVYPDTR